MTASTEDFPPGTSARSFSLFITALGVGQICSWGTLYYSFPLIAEAMGRDLGWTKTELYGAATLGLALSGLAAYPVGLAIDRGHGRIVMGTASILAGLLMFCWARVESLTAFYLAFAGIGLLQAATLYEPAFAVIARRFGALEARRGITALTLWGGFASTLFVPFTQILLDIASWRETLVVLGMINLLLCAALHFTAINPALDKSNSSSIGIAAETHESSAFYRAVHTPIFWALALAFTAYAATFSAFTFHIYPLLIERGLDAASAVIAISCIGPAQVAGRIAIWVFTPNASVCRIGSFIVIIFPLVIGSIMILPAGLLPMAAMAMIYGAANGIMTIVRGMAVPEMLSRQAYGAISGALTGPSLIAKAAAPAGAAALWATTQNYDLVLIIMVVGAALISIGFWIAAFFSSQRDRSEIVKLG